MTDRQTDGHRVIAIALLVSPVELKTVYCPRIVHLILDRIFLNFKYTNLMITKSH